jgi:hypothetical protein
VLAKVFSGYADESDRKQSGFIVFAIPEHRKALRNQSQKATAQSDVRALDSFFGTPGLMS